MVFPFLEKRKHLWRFMDISEALRSLEPLLSEDFAGSWERWAGLYKTPWEFVYQSLTSYIPIDSQGCLYIYIYVDYVSIHVAYMHRIYIYIHTVI